MRCPVDDNVLQMAEREGVEIDYCPECRGIWLDRGELDRIIEHASTRGSADNNSNETDHGDSGQLRPNKRKKGRLSFLGDLLAGGED